MVSEQGLADLRAKCPRERAKLIIEKCVHPMYRDELKDYFEHAQRVSFGQHTPHDLQRAFEMHLRLQHTGSMQRQQQTKPPTERDVDKAAKKIDQTANQ